MSILANGAWLVFAAVGLLMIATAATAQNTVTGKVRDAGTKQALPFASVYLNLTTIGTYTDEHGQFVLHHVPAGSHDLVVSHVGYQTYQTKILAKDDSTVLDLDVALVGQTLSAVTITSGKDDRWNSQLNRFHTLFFGNNALSKDCIILNSWVLDFKEDAANGFIAEASSPLRIENHALGYTLSYQIKKFQIKASEYVIAGVSWFQPMPTEDTVLINLWDRRRREAYSGSLRHLLKAIQTKKIAEERFSLYKDITTSADIVRKASFVSNLNLSIFPLDPGSIEMTRRGQQYSVTLPPKTEVHYAGRKAIPKIYRNVAEPISWIEVKGGVLEINNYGMVLNAHSVMVSGEMGEARISSMLPFDYEPKKVKISRTSPIDPMSSAPSKASELALLERPYLHTDKSYYYPDESIWFKAYINYYSRIYSDTLSKVLLVDLVDVNKRVVLTKLFPIDSTGAVQGGISLSKIPTGDYQLRAYTRWQLNFDKSLIFTKSIKLLASDEIPLTNDEPVVNGSLMEIRLAKARWKAGESLSFSVEAMNANGFPTAGSLSVSIVPAAYVAGGTRTPSIERDYNFTNEVLSLSLPTRGPYAIQQGIDISGSVAIPKKKRQKKNNEPMIILSQQFSDDMFTIKPESSGRFHVPAMQFFDSARFSAQAFTPRDKKQLDWVIDSLIQSPSIEAFAVLPAETVNSVDRRLPVYSVDSTLSLRVLNEVTITSDETRAKEVRGSAIHLDADIVITAESIKDIPNGDFLTFLQSRVSGLRVLTILDNGEVKKALKMGGSISFGNSAAMHEPLVMVDGMVLNGHGQTAADQLSSLSPNTVEHIEVVKFGGGASYGARGANGVISIYTNGSKATSKKEASIDKSLFRPVKVSGYAAPMKFRSPRYNASVAFGGSTIYWNPAVQIDGKDPANISFTIPNVTGDHLIVVEGISSEGKPLRAVRLVSIENE